MLRGHSPRAKRVALGQRVGPLERWVGGAWAAGEDEATLATDRAPKARRLAPTAAARAGTAPSRTPRDAARGPSSPPPPVSSKQ
eukprot:scaffold76134_cov62-Phaeocystis_antarctica.AAC.5